MPKWFVCRVLIYRDELRFATEGWFGTKSGCLSVWDGRKKIGLWGGKLSIECDGILSNAVESYQMPLNRIQCRWISSNAIEIVSNGVEIVFNGTESYWMLLNRIKSGQMVSNAIGLYWMLSNHFECRQIAFSVKFWCKKLWFKLTARFMSLGLYRTYPGTDHPYW